jgi:hypothetical protein
MQEKFDRKRLRDVQIRRNKLGSRVVHSFKIFWPMKPSYTSNEMTWFAAHFDVLEKIMIILKMCFSVKQIDDLQSSNKM